MTQLDAMSPSERLPDLISHGDPAAVMECLQNLPATEVARIVSRLSTSDRTAMLAMLEPEDAADVVEEVLESQAGNPLDGLPATDAAAIVDELRSDHQAHVLSELDEDASEAILTEMDTDQADSVRRRLDYESDSAGDLMLTEYLAFTQDMRVTQVIDDLRQGGEEYSDYSVQYSYVITGEGHLTGVLPMRALLLAPRGSTVGDLMLRDPLYVSVDASLDELAEFFENHGFLGVPVVEEDGRLVGVAHRQAVQSAQERHSERTFMEASGIVGGDELRSMPLMVRSRRRLAWLSVNILLNVVAASVIALYQDTLSAVIALAVFLPIISDMSGCSGNQAVAVTIRELTLGLLEPREVLRVLFAEMKVGLINGLALGCLIGAVAYVWQGNLWLGLVVGAALALNTVLAVCMGGLVPMFLRRLGKDPALASGPILTTVTDMCGFFLVLSLASMMLARLT